MADARGARVRQGALDGARRARLRRRSARSTTTATAVCSARCSTARRRSSRAPASCRPARRRDDAVLVTCAYLTDDSSPWVLQSLFLAAIGEGRDRGVAGDRGVRLPLCRGRVRPRALPRAQDGVPGRLPRGLRLPHRPLGRAASAWRGSSSAASSRCSKAGARSVLRVAEGGVPARAGAGAAAVAGGRPVFDEARARGLLSQVVSAGRGLNDEGCALIGRTLRHFQRARARFRVLRLAP